MICQSAWSSCSQATSSVVEVGVAAHEFGQRRHGDERRASGRPAHPVDGIRGTGWQDGRPCRGGTGGRCSSGASQVPTDRPLDELTAELTAHARLHRPGVRDRTAYPALGTWIDRGVYDDLLAGLGDGMAAGLGIGLGEKGTDSVFRRSFSVLVLADVRGPRQRPGSWCPARRCCAGATGS